jgi:hypothetical protein
VLAGFAKCLKRTTEAQRTQREEGKREEDRD